MRARFRGSAIAVRIRAAPVPPLTKGEPVTERVTPYTVAVDGQRRVIEVGDGAQRYEIARGLDSQREHEVTLVREAEAMAGVHQFLGFEVDGEMLEPPSARPYAIEIIGDSITCGYGVLGTRKDCPFSYATERASLAYGALAAELVDADLTTVCWSGLGVVRNYDGTRAPTMPELFEEALPRSAEASPWFAGNHARHPDVVVVALGTNDMDESTKTRLDLGAFESRYASFLQRVREVYPSSWVFVAQSPALPPEPMPAGPGLVRDFARGAFTRVVESRQRSGDTRVAFLELPWAGDRLGCDWHPNAEMHRVLAEHLVDALRPKLTAPKPR